jgi:hypothetical protein
MEESIADVWKKNKKAEVAAKELLKALERSQVTIGLRSQAALHCYEVDLSVSGQGGQDEEGQLEDKAFQMFSEAEGIIASRLCQHSANVSTQFVEPLQRYTAGLKSFQKSIDSQNILKEEYVVTDMAFRKQKASEADMQAAQNCYEVGVQRVIRDFDRCKATRSTDICNNLLGLCHLQVENSRMVSLAWEQLEQSLLSQENVNKHYSSDRYNITSYNSMKNSDRNNLHSGLNQAMLADLTHDEDDDADCISV